MSAAPRTPTSTKPSASPVCASSAAVTSGPYKRCLTLPPLSCRCARGGSAGVQTDDLKTAEDAEKIKSNDAIALVFLCVLRVLCGYQGSLIGRDATRARLRLLPLAPGSRLRGAVGGRQRDQRHAAENDGRGDEHARREWLAGDRPAEKGAG